MSIDHIVGYEKMSGKKYNSPLPSWVYEQKLAYPHHPRHSELIKEYERTKKQHDESVELVQSAYQRKWRDSENARLLQSVEQCQHHLEEAQKVLASAEEALREFNSHTPQQRICLYEVEIKEWEVQLVEARRAEQEYTKQLLDDPDAAAKRLERMVNGYSGEKVEYSAEQLSKLRSLKNDVESIEAKILSLQRDIQRIYELVSQQECQARIQAMMDVALPKFSGACARLAEAWGELQSLAAEHDIRIVSQHNLQLPTGAKFKQSNSPYEGVSSIHIIFSK